MKIESHVPLSSLTTMRLGGPASQVITVTSVDELLETHHTLSEENTSYFVLGGGSNVIAQDSGFDGVIILNRIPGFETLHEDDESATIRIGAGENWDSVVARACNLKLSGIEAMSAIPGTAGATPVQNVGAYGQEIADTFLELEALDVENGELITLSKDECHFSYRNSIFKNPKTRHHIITSLTLRLRKENMRPPYYASLQNYLDEHGIKDTSPATIRKAVCAIRSIKLPDPTQIANTGSFFKNPVLTYADAQAFLRQHPDAPYFPMPDGSMKVAAGWLIEQAGLKGFHLHGMKTYEHNALVLVNEAATSMSDLEAIRDHIITTIHNTYGITLEQEPELLS